MGLLDLCDFAVLYMSEAVLDPGASIHQAGAGSTRIYCANTALWSIGFTLQRISCSVDLRTRQRLLPAGK